MQEKLYRGTDRLWTYIIIAILFSAICWLIPLNISAEKGYLLPTAANFADLVNEGFENSEHMWLSLLFAAATYGPFLGAIVAVSLESGRKGLSQLFDRLRNWRVAPKWYGAVILIILSITLIPALLGSLSGIKFSLLLPLNTFLLLLVFELFTSGLGEEVGWRGYLQPKLQGSIQGERSIWISGLIWAVWHFPFVIALFSSNMSELAIGVRIPMILLSLAGFTMTIIGQTFIYAWLLNRSQSVFLAVIYHALGNTFATLFGAEQMASSALVLVPAIMPWIVVLVLQRLYGKESFLLPVGKS